MSLELKCLVKAAVKRSKDHRYGRKKKQCYHRRAVTDTDDVDRQSLVVSIYSCISSACQPSHNTPFFAKHLLFPQWTLLPISYQSNCLLLLWWPTPQLCACSSHVWWRKFQKTGRGGVVGGGSEPRAANSVTLMMLWSYIHQSTCFLFFCYQSNNAQYIQYINKIWKYNTAYCALFGLCN